ncbi:Echinoderm microtubule-associated protein-like 3 [Orchesella cincta]|uniref:Echinoderm microtubule-associated protein-like 3 n=1 Tax=Orchesella cincta TaxID=48709 RepID=A0A1D2MWJ8_ORCCI|nr:Echinoderm microtubule-associated protein-like 3 [Orchesella cincta]
MNQIGLPKEIPEQYGPVRAITEGRGSQLIVGTTKNCILAGSFQLPFQPVVQGHTDELWGLAVHPEQSQFLTGGHDKMLVLWDSLSHTAVWSLDFDVSNEVTYQLFFSILKMPQTKNIHHIKI